MSTVGSLEDHIQRPMGWIASSSNLRTSRWGNRRFCWLVRRASASLGRLPGACACRGNRQWRRTEGPTHHANLSAAALLGRCASRPMYLTQSGATLS